MSTLTPNTTTMLRALSRATRDVLRVAADTVMPRMPHHQPSLALEGIGGVAAPSAWGSDAGVLNPLNWSGLLLAVPKHKVSHPMKKQRQAGKGLKYNAPYQCSMCGEWKQPHYRCEKYNCGDPNRAERMEALRVARDEARALKEEQPSA